MARVVVSGAFLLIACVIVLLRMRTIREFGYEPRTRRTLGQLKAVALLAAVVFLVCVVLEFTDVA